MHVCHTESITDDEKDFCDKKNNLYEIKQLYKKIYMQLYNTTFTIVVLLVVVKAVFLPSVSWQQSFSL